MPDNLAVMSTSVYVGLGTANMQSVLKMLQCKRGLKMEPKDFAFFPAFKVIVASTTNQFVTYDVACFYVS